MKFNSQEFVTKATEVTKEGIKEVTEEIKLAKGNLDSKLQKANLAAGVLTELGVGGAAIGLNALSGVLLGTAILSGPAIAAITIGAGVATMVAPRVKYELWKIGILRNGYAPVSYGAKDVVDILTNGKEKKDK